MKYFTLLYIFISFHLSSFGQESEVTRLQFELTSVRADSALSRIYNQLSYAALAYDTPLATTYAYLSLEHGIKANEEILVAKALDILSTCDQYATNYDQSIFHANMGLKVLQLDTVNYNKNSPGHNTLAGQFYSTLGTASEAKGEYNSAISAYLKAKKAYYHSTRPDGVALSDNNLGITYLYLANYDKAYEHFDRSYKVFLSTSDSSKAIQSLQNMGIVHLNREEFDKAVELYTISSDYMLRQNDQRAYALCQSNLGDAYKMLGLYDSAISCLQRAIDIDTKLNNIEGLTVEYGTLGSVFVAEKDFVKARKMYDISLSYALSTGNFFQILTTYEHLYYLEEQAGNYENAYEYYLIKQAYEDTLKIENNSRALGKIEAEFSFHQLMEIEAAENQKKLDEEEAKSRKQRTITYYSLGILGVILIFVYLVFRNLQETKRQKELVVKAKEEIEHKNTEIVDSIKYARKIQLALLKDDKSKDSLPPHFFMFLPKDIVSGDFFWNFQSNEYWYVAVADCTGHGVPGAMLTMLGAAFLNDISASQPDLLPGEMLDQLKEKITLELGKTGETKDGMDISLLRLNLKSNELHWAGANNPLYYIRKGELIEVKADKQPVGFSENVTPFTTHQVLLEKGDIIYLFTDGYADQFGGEKGKKFKYSSFKILLSSLVNHSVDEQKIELMTAFEAWKGNFEQLDDVCVFGMKC